MEVHLSIKVEGGEQEMRVEVSAETKGEQSVLDLFSEYDAADIDTKNDIYTHSVDKIILRLKKKQGV